MTSTWRRALLPTLLILIVAGAIAYGLWPRPELVDLAVVERGSMLVTVDEEGEARVRDVYVVSAPVAGEALRIEIEAGEAVVAGSTVLATIRESDPAPLDVRARSQAQAAVRAARASLALAEAEKIRADAELAFARAELERARILVERSTISQRALDQAALDVATREANLHSAQENVRVRQFEVENALAALIQPGDGAEHNGCCVEIFSPVDGQVLRVLHESEGVIAPGAALLEVGDPTALEVVVDLLSTDAVRVAVGGEVEIVGWGADQALRGQVRRVEPYAFTKVSALGIEEQRVNVVIDMEGAPEIRQALGHGYRVEVRITVWRGEDVVKVPLAALFRRREGWAVLVDDDGEASLRMIEISHTNGVEAEVLAGLEVGERVVLHPGARIEEGARIAQRELGT